MIGICLLIMGTIAILFKRDKYLSSLGLTAIATSPNSVSGLVVATLIYFELLYILYH